MLSTAEILKTKNWEFYFIIGLCFISALVGWNASLDMELASLYYSPSTPDNLWPEKDLALWKFFYHAAPIITGGILLPSIIIYVMSYISKSMAKYRRYAAYVFLSALMGPGILINTIFKPYWGRPRPRQVLELGGHEKMHAYWQKGIAGNGYSFPCGHSSVGFALVSLAFLLKRKRPKAAVAVFAGSFGLGMVMGVGRMADGAHFFSDVLWSAVMSYIPAYYLYYKMKLYEDFTKEFKADYRKAAWQGSILFAALLVGVAVATPYKGELKLTSEKKNIALNIDVANIKIAIDDSQAESFRIEGKSRGFGFPKSKMLNNWSGDRVSTLNIFKNGYFSDYEANFKVWVRSDLEYFQVNIRNRGKVLGADKLPENYKVITPGETK